MEQPHLPLLRVFDELKFNVGKKTFLDFLKGDPNTSIEKNNLDDLESFGCLYMFQKEDLEKLVDELLKEGFLRYESVGGGMRVIARTSHGIKEVIQKSYFPQCFKKEVKNTDIFSRETIFTELDEKLFSAFDFFLNGFNKEQKKAIVTDKNSVLCIAGAGSGKTTVLTKRIEFLCKFRGNAQKKVLAITFTRKAKEEMQRRLNDLGMGSVVVETFNSFAEKYLRNKGHLYYDKEVRIASYREKLEIVNKIMDRLGTSLDYFYDEYFNKKQLREKTKDELYFIFVNDIYSILDYYKNKNVAKIEPFYELEGESEKKRVAKLMYTLCIEIEKEMKRQGLRDFSDQLVDVLGLFKQIPLQSPSFDHILVDEFQDVNALQHELLKILNPSNLFVVGDPRQAIYGWRGSDINYILNFPYEFEGAEIVNMKKNYRSLPQIVDVFNKCIEPMGLLDLESGRDATQESRVYLIEQSNEVMERQFVAQSIKKSATRRSEIFVLARTNKILENFADYFTQQGIAYTIKSEEEYKNGEPKEEEVVLATVHSIKGMEAEDVYVVGANTLSFPNKVADNFVFSLVKNGEEYEKEDEELRLFYVALSRAKENLIVTYSGNYTKFITDSMVSVMDFKSKEKSLFSYGDGSSSLVQDSNPTVLKNMLKDWRREKATLQGIPNYMILSNAAIDELAQKCPQKKVELHSISGLGEVKIAKYGDEILQIING